MSTTTLKGWIGVDLDGTLAHYDNWETHGENIGDIILPMKDRIIAWLGKDIEVRILTARAVNGPEEIKKIQDWLETNGLPRLMVTASKDFGMIELWDDRAVQVIPDTGIRADIDGYSAGYEEGYNKGYKDGYGDMMKGHLWT